MDQNRLSLLALHFIPGIGDYTIRQLVSYCGSAEKVFKTPKGKLLKIPGIGTVTVNTITSEKPFGAAEKELRIAEKNDTRLLFYTDRDYPYRLKLISDAPTLLYVKGNVDFENTKAVAIVGTRKSTDYGKQCVEELVESLIPHNALIVSGLAYGIDILTHKQALKHNLPTLGVMGSGMDIIYPAAHAETARKMINHGGLLTENPFGTKPDAHNFPARNRIIAGLCDALIVVEAAEKGGALITAEIANSYNKDVFAFPGNIGQSFSEGCNNLIKNNKAHLISTVKDLEYIMNWDANGQPAPKKEALNLEAYTPDEQTVLKTLIANNYQLMIDELSWRAGISVSTLASILLGLEFKGIIATLPGKVYK
ncbi:MAG TPA: DNA-processing protein DprA, partial [Ohtaekwangia sp.]|uniref:DNA-processing protein DprA n=1 Tax=Ohtaekwangia sp. TaxID=2066019 RepID=UPI002F931A15